MDFLEIMRNRKSCRSYDPDKSVSRDDLIKIVEAGRLSPSGCNSQPWKFVVVDDRAKLTEMADAAEGLGMNKFAHSVPVMVAVPLTATAAEPPRLPPRVPAPRAAAQACFTWPRTPARIHCLTFLAVALCQVHMASET